MAREELVADGAGYQCCFGTAIIEEWRCPRIAIAALDAETFMRYTDLGIQIKKVVLHGRSFCETHLDMIEASV